MTDIAAESMYYGILYCQIVLFSAGMLFVTLRVKQSAKKAIIQWLAVTIFSFIIGFGFNYLARLYGDFAKNMAVNADIWKVQLLYSSITLENILLHTLPAVIVVLAAIGIYEEIRNIKVFTSVLILLLVAAVFKLTSEISYIFFSTGNDGYQRMGPGYPMKAFLNTVWLALIFLIYWKYLKKRIILLLETAQEQISQIVLVPSLSYLAFQIVKVTLDTYGISLSSVDPGTFLIAIIVLTSMIGIYILMYWTIFKAIVASAQSAKVKAELDVASKIQMSALPSVFPAFPEHEEFDIYATMQPAKEVGGDFYDFFFIDEEHLAVLIADVSGKGVPAALFMMSGRAMIRNQALLGMDPGEVFKNANEQLTENNKEGMFITAFFGILNIKTLEFTYSNAGHNVPYICHSDNTVSEVPMHHGFVLAGMKGIRYRTEKLLLAPLDKLFFYTDGVTEATNPSLEMYAESRLVQTLQTCGQEGVQDTVQSVTASLEAFVDGAEQADDITILVLQAAKGVEDSSPPLSKGT